MTDTEEEELMQMVRDYIESGSTTSNALKSSQHMDMLKLQKQYIMLRELLKANDVEIEVAQRILTYMRDMGTQEMRTAASMIRWVVMRLKEDGYETSLCQSSWATTLSHSKGGYEYIDIVLKGGEKPTRLIVDIDFRSQFEVARPTSAYRKLTDTLPSIFVGTEEKLRSIISLLCSAAKESLKEKGLHVPPWRKASYMQSKWLSKDCKKVGVSPKTDMAII